MTSPQDRPPAPAPLVSVALLWIAGTLVGRYVPLTAAIWWVGGVAGLAGAVVTARAAHLAPATKAALAAAIVLLAAAACTTALHAVRPDHIAAFLHSNRSHMVTVTGRVVTGGQPDAGKEQSEFEAYPRPPQTRFLLALESVSTAEGDTPCSGHVDVAVDGVTWRASAGRRLRVAGRLRRVAAPSNPGQRDGRLYARRDGVVARLVSPSEELITVLDGGPRWPTRMLWRLRALSAQRLGGAAEPENRMLLRAMVLGRRPRELRTTQEAMVRAGVAHFLSISGLHLGILLGFAYLLMRLGRLSPRRGATIVLLLLLAYLLIVEVRTPILRGAMMAFAFCVAVILGRSACTTNVLAAAALVLLVADPTELFRPGFQLSFGTVAGILLLMRPVRRFLFGRWLDLRRLIVFGDNERFRRFWWHTILPRVADLVSVSVAAYLAALPLVAYHFGVITPLAPVASLVLLPLIAVILICGYLHLLLSWWLPNLAAQTAGPLEGLVDQLTALSGWLGRLPFCIDLLPIPIWAAVILALLVVVAAHHRRLRLSRGWACVVTVAGILVFVVATQIPPPARAGELAVLDVRNGMCAVLRTPSGSTFLFDAGSRSLSDPHGRVLAPFLRHHRWPSPIAAFISHGEIDHYNALPRLLQRDGPGATFVGPAFGRDVDPDAPLARFMHLLDAADVPRRGLHRGRQVRLDETTTVTSLWPPPAGDGYDTLSPNDGSLVLRLECEGVRILLPGDIQELPQHLLVELDPASLAADVLILPHHGSYTPALDAFIKAVDPRIVIRSSSYRQTGAAEQLGPLTVGRQFAATSLDGAIRIVCADGEADMHTFRSGSW